MFILANIPFRSIMAATLQFNAATCNAEGYTPISPGETFAEAEALHVALVGRKARELATALRGTHLLKSNRLKHEMESVCLRVREAVAGLVSAADGLRHRFSLPVSKELLSALEKERTSFHLRQEYRAALFAKTQQVCWLPMELDVVESFSRNILDALAAVPDSTDALVESETALMAYSAAHSPIAGVGKPQALNISPLLNLVSWCYLFAYRTAMEFAVPVLDDQRELHASCMSQFSGYSQEADLTAFRYKERGIDVVVESHLSVDCLTGKPTIHYPVKAASSQTIEGLSYVKGEVLRPLPPAFVTTDLEALVWHKDDD